MKINFKETIDRKSTKELETISKDTVFYSEEERLVALDELNRRGELSEELALVRSRMQGRKLPLPENAPTQRVYKKSMIAFSAFMAGPLAAGYLMSENFIALGQTKRAGKTWFYTILAAVIIFGGLVFLPEKVVDRTPKYVIPLLNACVAAALAEKFQGRNIDIHLNASGRRFSWWRVLLVSLITAAIMLACIWVIVIYVIIRL